MVHYTGTATSTQAVNGIPCVDPLGHRGGWKRAVQWLAATKWGVAATRSLTVPLDAALLKATSGRVSLTMGAAPVTVLISTGARSGLRRETPLQYFTDHGDVILAASNFGGDRHPGWYHNLRTHPLCELRVGPDGGWFVAREVSGHDCHRLFALATSLYPGYAKYAQRTTGIRTIRILRLTPA